MKEVLKLRKCRTGQWVTVAGMVLIGACMVFGNSVVFADDTQTYPIEVSDSNKFSLTDSPSLLSSENLGTNNREQEVATLSTTGQVDSSTDTTPEHMMSESSTVSLGTSDVATSETSTSVLASLSEVVPTKSTDRSEALVPSTISEAPKHAPTSEGAVAEVKIQSETLVEHSTNRKNEEESGDNLIYDIHNQEVTITDIKRKETIKKLIIPQIISNYRVTEIGSDAFSGSSLSEVVLPSTLTKIDEYAFYGTRITDLYIPDSVTEIGVRAFGNLTYSNNKPSTLTKVSLPAQINSAARAFQGQENLKEVVFRGNWKTIPDEMFSDTGLEKLVIPEGVTEIGYGAFSGSSLKEVVLPSTLTRIGDYAFSGTKLTSITLPTSVTDIGRRAFGDIDSLTSIVIPKNLTNGSEAFSGSKNLSTINFEEGITKIGSGIFANTGLKSLTIPSTVTEIGASAFYGTRITDLYIPDSVTKLEVEAFGDSSYAFSDPSTLTKVSLPTQINSAAGAFQGQENLKEVVFRGNWKTIPDGMFSGTGLEKIVIPEGVTEIGYGAFSGSSLKEVVLPRTLTKIGDYAFSGTKLTSITLPTGITEIGSDAFSGSSLKEVVLPSTLKKIDSEAFRGTQLTSITLPEGVTEIGSDAFLGSNLKEVVLPSTLKKIGSGAFRNTKLETIEIPEGVTYLDDSTLANIPTLKSVYLPKSLTTFAQSWDRPHESVEYHVYLDSFALQYVIDKQLNFKLRDENVANDDDSKVLDSSNSYYLTTTTGTRRQGYLGLDLKYAIKKDKSSDDGRYVIHLNIPSTTKVFESKVRVNGQDITATVSDGYLDIPVSEEIGKIKLMLMTENRELTNVRLFAQLSYQKDRRKVSENIGAINVNIPVLTLTANRVTSRSYSRISGVADPNEQVIAYLDDMTVGQVKIKKDGSYTFDVPLVTPVDNKEYTIKVKSISSDGREISETTTVRYEKNYPELVNFIMRHNGYTYNLKENQDKVPVISFRPGGQFDFEVEYTNTEQIENIYLVSVREGIKKYVQLYYDENLKKYIYHGYFDEKNTSYVPGKLELQIINKEKRIPSILIELEGKKIDYLSSDFKEKYKIIDELNQDKFVTRIINRETQKVVLTEEISIDILKELFDNIQNNSESQPKTSSILVKEEENNLGFRSAEGTKGEPILNLFYALLLEEAGNINLNQFFSPAKFTLDELYKIPELIFRKYAGLSKDLSTVSDSVFDGIVDKQLGNKAIKDEFAKVPGLEKIVNNIGVYQELGTFVLKWSMLELLEQLLENPKLVIQGNYKYNALQTIKREKNNFINASTLSIGVSLASNSKHVALGALIYDFGATFYNFIRGIGGKLEKWERIPTVSGLPESIYENIIDDLKIGAPTLTNWKVKTPSNNTKEEDIGTKAYSNSFDVSNLFSVRYTTPHNNLSRFTSFNIPAFQFVVDPSGIVINNVSKKPVTGATINLYYQGENGEEILWDAGEYSQFNPLLTTVNGEYAWDVPEGFWKVKVSKEGYESAESDWLPVPPPQTEVHFNLKPLSYKIAYKVGDGILKEDVPRSYQTDVDTELPYPVRKGYVFTGWYLDDNFSGEPFFNTLFDKAGDKVLYAKWEKDTKILSDDDNVVTVTVSGNDVNVIGKVVKKEVTNADILEKVGDHNNLLMEIQALDDDGNVVSLSEEAEIELAVISGQKPYKVLHYVKDKSTFEEVPFNWNEKDKNISLTTSTLGVYLIQNKLAEKQMTSKVRQESRILKTDKVEYVNDASLDAGKIREVAAVDGQVLVEITDIYVNGELQSSTEKELSRIEPQAKKVYRGTKQVSQVPDVAPIEVNRIERNNITKEHQGISTVINTKLEPVVMNQSSSEPLSSKETTIRTKGYLPNTSSEYGYGFEWAGIIALASAHFGIISNKRKKNIKN